MSMSKCKDKAWKAESRVINAVLEHLFFNSGNRL